MASNSRRRSLRLYFGLGRRRPDSGSGDEGGQPFDNDRPMTDHDELFHRGGKDGRGKPHSHR